MEPRDWVKCNWCGGGSITLGPPGCAACFNARRIRLKQLDEQYAAEFPNGPVPLLTAQRGSVVEMEAVRRLLNIEEK